MASRPQPTENLVCSECPRVLRTHQGLIRHLRALHGVVLGVRRCSTCKEQRHVGEFGQTGVDRRGLPTYRSECDLCRSEVAARYREQRGRHETPADRRIRRYGAKRTFGLSLDEVEEARERFEREQGGVCAICKLPPTETEPLALDHCHETGELRGLLCRRCNVGLGYFQDNTDRLVEAAAYLSRKGG